MLAASVAHERRFREVPSADEVIALAKAEGASAAASLVAVRWALFDKDVKVIPVDGLRLLHGPAVVGDDVTLWALDAFSERGIVVTLNTPEGRRIPKRTLSLHAASWPSA